MKSFKFYTTALFVIFVTLTLSLCTYTSIKGDFEKAIDGQVWETFVKRDRIPLWRDKCYHPTPNGIKPKLMTYGYFIKNMKGFSGVKRSYLNEDINPKPNIRISVKPIKYLCEVAPYERKSHLVFRSRIRS